MCKHSEFLMSFSKAEIKTLKVQITVIHVTFMNINYQLLSSYEMQGVKYLLLLLWYESSTANVLTQIRLFQTLKTATKVASQDIYGDAHG